MLKIDVKNSAVLSLGLTSVCGYHIVKTTHSAGDGFSPNSPTPLAPMRGIMSVL